MGSEILNHLLGVGIRKYMLIEFDKIDKVRGMDINFATTANSNDEAKALLEAFNFPFKK